MGYYSLDRGICWKIKFYIHWSMWLGMKNVISCNSAHLHSELQQPDYEQTLLVNIFFNNIWDIFLQQRHPWKLSDFFLIITFNILKSRKNITLFLTWPVALISQTLRILSTPLRTKPKSSIICLKPSTSPVHRTEVIRHRPT